MHHVHEATPLGFPAVTAIWFVMMAVMMAPTVWPWVRSFHRFGRSSRATTIAATSQFAAGYLLAWLGYSVAAAGAQLALRDAVAHAPIVFVAAGLYQFGPLKRACLTHCRSPFSYFLVRWRNGPAGALRMGLEHGAYCVGCCWALMATTLVTGMMNLWWMTAVAGVALAEQVAPHGQRLRVPLGIALVAAGLWQLSAAI